MAATQKTLTPTNEVISIPAFADKPDYRLPIDSTGKLADAINELDRKTGNFEYKNFGQESSLEGVFMAIPNGEVVMGKNTDDGQWLIIGYRYSTDYGAMLAMHYSGSFYFCSKNGPGAFSIRQI